MTINVIIVVPPKILNMIFRKCVISGAKTKPHQPHTPASHGEAAHKNRQTCPTWASPRP